PELLSIRYCNISNAYRNIFIKDRLVIIASQYYKGFYTRNNIKIIYRYLPPVLGEIII
ncbi:hypothetical protein BO71DRAFT_337631, partial [Aspergillus ellipticus CBS 707.79]